MTDIERQIEKLYAALPSIKCKRLCQECCGPIGMTRLEWERIRAKHGDVAIVRTMPMRALSGQAVSNQAVITQCHTCPMLQDGACSIYPLRPAICRLWGLTKRLRCPFGCTPQRWVSEAEAYQLFIKIDQLSVTQASSLTGQAGFQPADSPA